MTSNMNTFNSSVQMPTRDESEKSREQKSMRDEFLQGLKFGSGFSETSSSSTSGSELANKKKPNPPAFEIAFEQDVVWQGKHPYRASGESAARLDKMIPSGYRYARELQHEVAYIPPENHKQSTPGEDFIIAKGKRAIPIVAPDADTAKKPR